jgi:V8-like Glu-specific endopeptidase
MAERGLRKAAAPNRLPTQPLTARKLRLLRSLRPVEKPPRRFELTFGQVKLPPGSKVNLVRVRGARDLYRVRVMLHGSDLGHRLEPDSIPTQRIDRSAFKPGERAPLELSGHRPQYLRVDHVPGKVALRRSDVRYPPIYRKLARGLDRPTNVFPPDQRYIYKDTSFPWCTVGRVDSPLGTATGCTIGSRLLLTCNHVIQWNTDGTAGWVRFRPAYYNGSAPFGEAWATRVIWWMQVTGGDGLSDLETAFDYVVCVLGTRMGDVVGYPGYRAYDDDWNGGTFWQHMGYPVDLSGTERPAFQGECVVSSAGSQSTSGQTGLVLGHFNDIVPGHSGGPAWGWWDGEPWPRVVGVQSAEAATPAQNTSGDNEFGGGPALSSLISWARSNYP